MRWREEFVIHSYFRGLLTHHHSTAQSNAANIRCCNAYYAYRLWWRFVCFLVFSFLFFCFIRQTVAVCRWWGRTGGGKGKKNIQMEKDFLPYTVFLTFSEKEKSHVVKSYIFIPLSMFLSPVPRFEHFLEKEIGMDLNRWPFGYQPSDNCTILRLVFYSFSLSGIFHSQLWHETFSVSYLNNALVSVGEKKKKKKKRLELKRAFELVVDLSPLESLWMCRRKREKVCEMWEIPHQWWR